MKRVLACAVVILAGVARAEDVRPADGAQARVLSCNHLPRVEASVITWTEAEGRTTLQHQTGSADGPLPGPKPRGGKPEPGCPHGFPPGDANWKFVTRETWTRTAEGAWVDSKGRAASLTCTAATLRAVEKATALVSNPASDGCGGERQLILKGAGRVTTPVVRCKLTPADGAPLTLTFGATLVRSDNDCGGGADWAVGL